ncbi:MAG: TetR/AcrR family transcriptional regulator [Pseudomonadota bacterium]
MAESTESTGSYEVSREPVGGPAAGPTPWAATVPDREAQHAIKRRVIAEHAAILFNEKGFHATSLNELAERLNVTKGALYHYVCGKDDIAVEILRIITEESKAVMAAASSAATGLERLRLFFVHYARMMATPVGACGVQIGSLPHSDDIRGQMTSFLKDLDARLRAILKAGVEDGSIAAEADIRMTDFAVFGALHWLSRWYREDGPASPEELGEALFDTFVRGLAPRPAASA